MAKGYNYIVVNHVTIVLYGRVPIGSIRRIGVSSSPTIGIDDLLFCRITQKLPHVWGSLIVSSMTQRFRTGRSRKIMPSLSTLSFTSALRPMVETADSTTGFDVTGVPGL